MLFLILMLLLSEVLPCSDDTTVFTVGEMLITGSSGDWLLRHLLDCVVL